MPKFRKKPIVIEAEQFDGVNLPKGVYDSIEGPYVITIHEQKVFLSPGDWVIPEPDGIHYYPCTNMVFRSTYEPCE